VTAATKRRRPPARRGGRRVPRRPSEPALTRARDAVAAHLGRQSDDVWGVILVVAGLLAAFGIYADLTGPVGRMLRSAAGYALGWGRYGVPVGLCAVGGVLLRGRPREEPARIGIGCGLVVLASSGLLDLTRGAPAWGAPTRAIVHAGGYVGAAVAEPLRAVLADWGAGLVLASVVVVGALILTKMPARHAATAVVRAAIATAAALRRGVRWLAHVGDHGEVDRAVGRHPASIDNELYDQAADAALGDDDLHDVEVAPASPIEEPPITPPPVRLTPAAKAGEQLAIELAPGEGGWRLPPVALLKRGRSAEVDRRPIEAAGRVLEDALASHGVETRLVGMTVGPTVARYELELGAGVKVGKVTSLSKDIAYAMAAEDVRILAPIPGKSAVGVEVPNRQRQLVSLGDVLTTEEARRATHPLEVALGRDINGRGVMVNLADMPHILIAGATGAGKSSCINSLITSILTRATPDQVRLILVDPKRVELGQYDGVPHLLTQVVVNPKKAANALSWAVTEMERRYDLLSEVGVRDITGYNAAYDRGDLQAEPPLLPDDPVREYHRLPFVLVVVDELNDLMMVAARDVEESICRIAQMARAVGIHLVIATQRPSVDVITGVIKANIPSRLAFKVSSLADSRVILDQPGAEKLVGKGDMLLLSASSSQARRIQGCWVSEEEARKVVAHWRRQAAPQYIEGVEGDAGGPGGFGGNGDDDDDDLVAEAMELVVRSQLGSTSMLQRKLRVGFARAGRIMDLLERRGVVGPSEGSKSRAVLMTVEELEALQSRTP
jgi:DNA segregation ATPase FtsK/SpoIIIE, S-DNA-T family